MGLPKVNSSSENPDGEAFLVLPHLQHPPLFCRVSASAPNFISWTRPREPGEAIHCQDAVASGQQSCTTFLQWDQVAESREREIHGTKLQKGVLRT